MAKGCIDESKRHTFRPVHSHNRVLINRKRSDGWRDGIFAPPGGCRPRRDRVASGTTLHHRGPEFLQWSESGLKRRVPGWLEPLHEKDLGLPQMTEVLFDGKTLPWHPFTPFFFQGGLGQRRSIRADAVA